MLIGRNGSGKSTLISLLLQLYQPTGGKITLNGIDISQQKKPQLKIIIIGCVHSIYQDLPECKTEDIYITLKNAYSLFFDFILDRAS